MLHWELFLFLGVWLVSVVWVLVVWWLVFVCFYCVDLFCFVCFEVWLLEWFLAA
jgi:hypothetical protein